MSRADQKSVRAGAGEAGLLAEAIRDVVGRLVRSVREHSGTHSNAQNETLAVLERSGPVSIAVLAEHRGVTHQTMRLIVMKLVDQGLLRLKQDDEDRRAYLVHVTDMGREQTAQDRAARTQWLTEQLLDKTNREERKLLKAAVQTLDKLMG
jgi:DNA-binding MarR family transcriptional regulator